MTLSNQRHARRLWAATVVGVCLAMAFSVTKLMPSAAAAEPSKGVAGQCEAVTKVGAAWWYNWYVEPGSCQASEFVPMVSGEDAEKRSAGDIAWQMDQVVKGGHKTVLGFNEPDRSNMTVAQAVDLWPTLTSDSSITVGSPAPTAGQAGNTWLEEFMKQVDAKKLRVDFIALHWYGWDAGSCNATSLESYIKWAESITGNRNIWITEFGCMHESNTDMATVTKFYKDAVEMFSRHPRIVRYAWYPHNTHNEILNSAGELTSLGSAIAGTP